MVLHVPPGPHLTTVNSREKPRSGRTGNKLRVKGDALEFRAEPILLVLPASSRNGCSPCVAAEENSISVPVRL
jgi:hypothetical protein